MVKKPKLTKRDLDRERNRLAEQWREKQKSLAREMTPKDKEKFTKEMYEMAKQYRDNNYRKSSPSPSCESGEGDGCNVMGGKKTAKRRHKHRRKRSTRRRR